MCLETCIYAYVPVPVCKTAPLCVALPRLLVGSLLSVSSLAEPSVPIHASAGPDQGWFSLRYLMRCLKHSIISTLNSIISTLFSLRYLMHCLKQAFPFLGVVYNNVCQVGWLVGWLHTPEHAHARARSYTHTRTHARMHARTRAYAGRCRSARSAAWRFGAATTS